MKKTVILGFLSLILGVGAFAQEEYVNEGFNGKVAPWHQAKTWGRTGNDIPGANDDVIIQKNSRTPIILISQDVEVRNLTLIGNSVLVGESKPVLNFGGILTPGIPINGGIITKSSESSYKGGGLTLTIPGEVEISGGDYSFGNASLIVGRLIVTDGGSLTIEASLATDTIILENGGTISFGENGSIASGETITVIVGEGSTIPDFPDGVSVTVLRSRHFNTGKWTFVGLPHSENVAPLTHLGTDNIWALEFNYANNNWGSDYLHYTDDANCSQVQRGHGIFVYTDADEVRMDIPTDFTTVTSATLPDAVGNRTAQQGRWFALSNPNATPLDIATFLSANTGNVNGGVVYTYSGTSFGGGKNSGEIAVGEGFFVNMQNNKSTVTFPVTANKSTIQREFISLSVSTDGYKVPVMFAANDEASEAYDRFDANKMFGSGTVAEPYLVSNGTYLCKEEVNVLPYTATMNVRSGEACSVVISADCIPEAYTLILVDGMQEIELSEGEIYETTLVRGENENRFSLKIGKNNVSIQEFIEAESLNVRSNNRHITIEGGNDMQTCVYNVLGQKVYETNQRTFELNSVAAGAYIVKTRSGSLSYSSKIVIR